MTASERRPSLIRLGPQRSGRGVPWLSPLASAALLANAKEMFDSANVNPAMDESWAGKDLFLELIAVQAPEAPSRVEHDVDTFACDCAYSRLPTRRQGGVDSISRSCSHCSCRL